jgi:transcriptional regulator with XRE-family HTH domain
VSVISKRFAEELNDKRMRDAYLSAQTRTKLVNQIRTLRDQRGWSQGEFAHILGKPQSNVSRLENREYGNFNLKTLFELASAFDVGLMIEFVPYEEFLKGTQDLNAKRLRVESFKKEALEPLRYDSTPVEITDILARLSQTISNLRQATSHLERRLSTIPTQKISGEITGNYFIGPNTSVQSIGPPLTVSVGSIPMIEINPVSDYGMGWVNPGLSGLVAGAPWVNASNLSSWPVSMGV